MKKSARKTTDPTLIIQRKLTAPVVTFLANTPITANQITICNFLIFATLSAYFFFKGGFVNNLLGLANIVIYSYFDLVDGGLARQKNIQSSFGHWLDMSLDSMFQTIIMFIITLNILIGGTETWRLMALLPLLGQGIANVLGIRLTLNFGVDAFIGNVTLDKLFQKKRSFIDHFIKNMVAPTDIFFLSLFTLRFYMLVGIFLNILPYTFILFGIAIIIRALSMYLILSFHYAKPEFTKKYATFLYLDSFRK